MYASARGGGGAVHVIISAICQGHGCIIDTLVVGPHRHNDPTVTPAPPRLRATLSLTLCKIHRHVPSSQHWCTGRGAPVERCLTPPPRIFDRELGAGLQQSRFQLPPPPSASVLVAGVAKCREGLLAGTVESQWISSGTFRLSCCRRLCPVLPTIRPGPSRRVPPECSLF